MDPVVVLVAGPNGAGKSTAAPRILRDEYGITQFVNADTIAVGLSAYAPENVSLEAGRLMLRRLDELGAERASFAFETTLAGRTFAPFLRGLIASGYTVHLYYFWLPSPELAVARVATRVRQGGHHVPDETVRRRYDAGLRNFLQLYRPIAQDWKLFDNEYPQEPRLIANGSGATLIEVPDTILWERLERQYSHGRA